MGSLYYYIIKNSHEQIFGKKSCHDNKLET